jgi:putative ABC transport system permease protein
MFTTALTMLFHNLSRFCVTLIGISFAFFLAAAQVGLLVGWCNTNSAIIRHARVDVWVMARQTKAFDYGTAIPKQRLYQVRSIAGVAWAEGMTMSWNIWQRPDGQRVNVELVGLDTSGVGGPWDMRQGTVDVVHLPHSVIVDHLYLRGLGIEGMGEEVEMLGRRAVVRGLSQGVRTFTASPFVFTSIESAIKYDKRYREDEITYVLVRCADGYTAEQVRDAIAQNIPHIEALTAQQFARRTMQYWMLETGVGIPVVITALLGFLVGAIIMSQTLYGITQDHLSNYATLLALGFYRCKLVVMIVLQSFVTGLSGIAIGTAGFVCAACASATTPIPLEMIDLVYAALIGIFLVCCLAASFISVRSLFRLDPVTVFKS